MPIVVDSQSKKKVKQSRYRPRGGPEDSSMIKFPHFMTTAHDDGRWLALRTDRLYAQEMLLVLISVRG